MLVNVDVGLKLLMSVHGLQNLMTAKIPGKTGQALLFDAQTHRVSTGSSAPSDALTQIYRWQEAASTPSCFSGYLGTSMLKLSKFASRITHTSGFTMQLALGKLVVASYCQWCL